MFQLVSRRSMTVSLLSVAIATTLSACGGGGGGGGQVIVPNPPPPTSGPQPPVVTAVSPNLAVAYDVTNVAAAHAAGFTGAGVNIGVVDSGVTRNNPALYPRVIANLTYISSKNDLTVDDKVGHGTAVSLSMAGTAWGAWPGGVAKGSNIISARIIADERPTDDGSGQGNEVSGALGLEPIHDDLIARGARIMNNSWGGLYWTNLNATAPIANEYRRFIFSNDGLVVFATGNEGRANPTDMSSLPSKPGPSGTMPAADLERGWLAVAALASGKKPGTDVYMTKDEVLANPALASYSNACGFAMRYCLVAPGDVVVPGKDDPYNAPTYWRYGGTSLAAPQVSGTAALVWQAFPWFNNDLVRQTILGTAKDIGAPGVDPVFGYGLLDVGKAVKGPAKLDWGSLSVAPSAASTFANDISGAGGITKSGAGNLTLAGNNTYTGLTQINAGTLTVAKGFGGSLINGATLALSGAGPHNVAGNFTQMSSGTLSYLVGAPLKVTGTATLAGTLNVAGKVAGYTNAAKETVVNAAGGLSGTFGTLTQSPGVFLQGSLSYDANNAFLNITSLSVSATAAALGFTPAALGGADRVEGAFGGLSSGGSVTPGSGFAEGGGAIQTVGSNRAAEHSLASLNGELLTTDLAFSRLAMDDAQHRLDRRLDSLTDSTTKAGTWFTTTDTSSSLSGGMGINAAGWRVGQDLRLSDRSLLGVSLAESRGMAYSQLRPDQARTRSVDATLYGLWSLPHGVYLSGSTGIGRLDQFGQRQIALGDYGFDVTNRLTDSYRRSALQTGYSFKNAANSFRITPYLGVQQFTLQRGAFNELGAMGFGLQSGASTLSASHAIAGLRFNSMFKGFNLFGFAEQQRLLNANGVNRDASFTGFELASPITGITLADKAYVFGGGLMRGGLSFSLDGRHENGTLYKQAAVSYRKAF